MSLYVYWAVIRHMYHLFFFYLPRLHSEAIHEKFTKKMFRWEIKWESLMWYEFLNCTALYIASSYARPEITGWLLGKQNGSLSVDERIGSLAPPSPLSCIVHPIYHSHFLALFWLSFYLSITENGADPNVLNHANLKAIDVVGQCRKCKEDEDKVKELLERPLRGK